MQAAGIPRTVERAGGSTFPGLRSTLLAARSGFAAFDLSPPPALRQVSGRFVPCRLTDRDLVDYCCRTGCPGKPGSGALVLNHVRLAFQSRHAALDVYLEVIGGYFGGGQFCAN